ncbi:Calx-beta domain-containing protein [uncultured Sneathiella sp.]|uniref:T1SS-143 repeat domain-containing protein n=1 Tax=uncultured Sneathiella sp. TaxID=879315 RepID=UPI0030D9C2B5|tara:strand:- start:170 stop:4288 length:4119 start_codon:yes stop_codon:yes gene_type:complete
MKQGFSVDLDTKALAEYQAPDHGAIQIGDEIKPLIAVFGRDGVDLTLTDDVGNYIIIHDYFVSGPGADLLTAGGARIPADLVSKLAGPGPIAQSSGTLSDAGGPIGEVTALTGTVTTRHTDGTGEELVQGATVFQGDVIETESGSSFIIVFADDTQFTMGENGRAVLDEMIYDPSAGSGKFGVSLLQGVFSLVSGQIAKDDPENVDVRTPVGTIGIRGTSWSGNVKSIGEESIFTLFTGAIVITNEAGSQVLNVANQSVVVTSFSTLPSVPFILTGEQLFNIYGEALRLVNPDWFNEEDDFDPDEINPEAGRRAQSGGGANFQQYSEGGIDGGLSIGDLLKAGGLLDGTDLRFRDLSEDDEIVGLGPQTSLSVVSVVDPESGNLSSFQIVITLNEPTDLPVTITYEIRGGSASQSDSGLPGDGDFVSNGNGTIVIPPGSTQAVFTVEVIDDDVIENLEFFIVALTGAENADIDVTSGQALVVITDDDIGVVTLSDVTVGGTPVGGGEITVGEGAGVLSFALTLDKAVAPGVTVSVDYAITGSTTAGSDYLVDGVQRITFNGGTTGLAPGSTVTVNIPIIDDNQFEGTETLTLTLVGASSNAVIAGTDNSITLTIEDNDDPVIVDEGTSANLVEAIDGDGIEGATIGIGGGSGEIASVTFDTAQLDFDAANLTSQGNPVSLSGLGTNVVVGTAGGETVFTVTLNTDGTYDVSLDGPIDHIDGAGGNLSTLAFSLAITVLDVNSSSASGAITIEVEDSAPILGAALAISVDEDDLPNGSDLTPDATSASGTAEIDFGLDGAGTVTLDISGLPEITSGGDPVFYEVITLANGVTQQVTATAFPDGGAPRSVFVLEFGPTGSSDDYGYTLTLNDGVDHAGEGQDALDLPFGYDVVDQDGSSVSGSFVASIVDDVPIAAPDAVDLPAPTLPTYNLVFVLDTSGSMNEAVLGSSQTRIEVLREAVSNVLSEYNQVSSNLNISIIAFAAASSVVFQGESVAAAQDFINNPANLVPSGTTNYAAAVSNTEDGAQGILEAQLADPSLSGYASNVYFISDGEPSANLEVPTAGGNEWQEFVDSNDIEVIAVGLGAGISTTELAKVENAGDAPTLVVDPNDLETVLVDTVPVVEIDNVVSSGSVDRLGADDGTLTSLIYNGAEYDIPQNGDPLIIETTLGGMLSIDAEGNYTYTAPSQANPGEMESFEYVLTDGDNDTSSAILSFTFVEDGEGAFAAFSAFTPAASSFAINDENLALFGTSAGETIIGQSGDDLLQGNGGDDILTGGQGADIYVFTGADNGAVTITDFDSSEDVINLDQIFDDLGILAENRSAGDAWQLAEADGRATLTFLVANGPTITIDNYVNPDVQALEDIAARIVVDES